MIQHFLLIIVRVIFIVNHLLIAGLFFNVILNALRFLCFYLLSKTRLVSMFYYFSNFIRIVQFNIALRSQIMTLETSSKTNEYFIKINSLQYQNSYNSFEIKKINVSAASRYLSSLKQSGTAYCVYFIVNTDNTHINQFVRFREKKSAAGVRAQLAIINAITIAYTHTCTYTDWEQLELPSVNNRSNCFLFATNLPI